MPVLSTA